MTAMMNPFKKDISEYTRSLSIPNEYIKQTSIYLQKMTGRDIEYCTNWVITNMKEEGKFPIFDPKVRFLSRDLDKDRIKRATTLTNFYREVSENNFILSPSLTAYQPTSRKRSLLGKYVLHNLELRSQDKKLMFEWGQKGDKVKENAYNTLQNKRKLKNNSISGMMSIYSTVMANSSAHSSLTSTCRVATSYANVVNERLIAGSRHYWCYESIQADILKSCQVADKDAIDYVVKMNQLYLPTTTDIMQMITREVAPYFKPLPEQMEKLTNLVDALDPIEKCAYLYTGDMFHFAQYNGKYFYGMINDFVSGIEFDGDVDPDEIISSLDSDKTALASLYCSDFTRGKVLKDLLKKDPEAKVQYARRAHQINLAIDKYADYIQAFLRLPVLPASVYRTNAIMRRAVIASDTDSTIVTNQYWTEWYTGKLDWDEISYKVGYTITYISSQVISHVMSMVSKQLGSDMNPKYAISMKNEYYMPVIFTSSSAKNYFYYISAREGNVYDKMKLDVKGVQFRGSNTPSNIQDALETHMKYVMDTMMENNGHVSLAQLMIPFVELEHEVLNGLKRGDSLFFKSMGTKSAEGYKAGEDNPTYKHHLMWEEVFAPYRQAAPALPYRSISINTVLTNKTSLNAWLDKHKNDKDFHAAMSDWISRNNKTSLPVMRAPRDNVAANGLPDQILTAMDVNGMICSVLAPFYLMIESFGYFVRNKRNTRLVSEEFPLESLKTLDHQPETDKAA